MKNFEIIVIDDDQDDCEFFDTAFQELKIENPTRFFYDATSAFNYLKACKHFPFLVICDVNMPGLNGLEFKEMINDYNDSRLVATPFVFISTSANPSMLRFAQSLNIQGYFQKPGHINELKDMLFKIVNYWDSCYKLCS